MVQIKPDGHYYCVSVSDNGQGISDTIIDKLGQETVAESKGTGTALVNLNNRLNLLYGSVSCLHFSSDKNGTKVWYRIPNRIREDEHENFNS